MTRALAIGGLSLVVGLLPGMMLFRAPILARDKRAALASDERAFWCVLLSVAWSIAVTMALAAASVYRLERLVWINLGLTAALVLLFRGRLRLGAVAPRAGAGVVFSLAVVALCAWRFFPASETILGGKDPGVYVNEGINIDRSGALFRRDAVIAALPESIRDLFFRPYGVTEYYSLRFMGVSLNNPATGEVIADFPHLFPASVAIGYGIAGIRGATNTVPVWALLGVMAVYFVGVRLVGRWAAFLACAMLTLNVVETWFGRYPNAEVVQQTLLFSAMLAFARSMYDDDRFFAWVAGMLCALLIFLRFDAFLAVSGLLSACALAWIVQRRPPHLGFLLPLAAGTVLGLLYYSGPMQKYFFQYRLNLPSLNAAVLGLAVAVAVVVAIGTQRKTLGPLLTKYLPHFLAVVLAVLAAYALFFRQPGGRLLESDAYALRTFREAYVFWPALVAALAGFAIVNRREFWRDPAFFIVFAVFAVFFFRKIHVVPEHFWLARRFLPMILPGMFLLVAGAAVGSSGAGQTHALSRRLAGTVFVLFICWQYVVAAAPVAAHVEYRGAIHAAEQLAARVGDRDILVVEGRGASDIHVLALPVTYAFGRNVLVIDSELPDRRAFERFLDDAVKRYDHVFMAASGGTDLLSERVRATPVASGQVLLPEYATAPWNQYPAGPRQKDLSYNLYQLTLGTAERGGFVLDIGTLDDLNIVRFHARETGENRTFRWTMPRSFIAATGLTGSERTLTLVMHDGGRPAAAPQAAVEVFFNGISLGRVTVDKGFKTYTLTLPADAVARAAQSIDPAQIRLESTTWSPRDYLGGTDDRQLGVMIDRVEIH